MTQFHELLSACGATPVRALVASLDGCAGGRAGEIVAAAGLERMLCKDVERDQAARLLKTARDAVKPVNPKRLGGSRPRRLLPDRPTRLPTARRRSAPASRTPSSRSRSRRGRRRRRRRALIVVFINRTPVAARASNLYRDKTDIDVFGCGLAHTVATAPKGTELQGLHQCHLALRADHQRRQGAEPATVLDGHRRRHRQGGPQGPPTGARRQRRRRTSCSTISTR